MPDTSSTCPLGLDGAPLVTLRLTPYGLAIELRCGDEVAMRLVTSPERLVEQLRELGFEVDDAEDDHAE